ncbi:MAG: preprotein translocase subunit SecA, partial [Anaplasmataceae bacterium]|nr:preprotein translocase subunit SecA [Anaplasmataceae bacterium]
MFNYLKDIITSTKRSDKKRMKSYYKLVDQINTVDYLSYTDDELISKHHDLKKIVAENNFKINVVLPEAFALIKEVSFRVLGMRHFDVQLIGGMALNDCMISEMATGEGKTLMSTLPAYLNSLAGRGVHMVTVNDYLARRDSEWMGQIYRFLGMECSYIIADLSDKNRKIAYNADITYATNNELGFDYLRDNMKFSRNEMVMRDLHYAIIDEVDSILIDEARTPLIISGQIDDDIKIYSKINNLIKYIETEDIEIDFKNKNVSFTDNGVEKIEKILVENKFIKEGASLYTMDNMSLLHYLEQGVKAHNLFTKDKDYIVKDKKIILIDEFTGRMMDGRRYADGLHQFLEAKEGVEVNKENQTLSSITFQNYFRLYDKLAGMTGTAATEAEEFIDIYGLNVVQIPTNVPVARIDYEDAVYCTFEEKLDAIIDLVKECNDRQQPILIGTANIDKSEAISDRLYKEGLVHSVLNAKNHLYEASIIAKAGELSAITIATNMAGRGTDIKLGGNLDFLLSKAKSEKEKEDITIDYQNKKE